MHPHVRRVSQHEEWGSVSLVDATLKVLQEPPLAAEPGAHPGAGDGARGRPRGRWTCRGKRERVEGTGAGRAALPSVQGQHQRKGHTRGWTTGHCGPRTVLDAQITNSRMFKSVFLTSLQHFYC